MPSKSKAQQRLMQAAAHNPKIAKDRGISQSVAQEFTKADKKAGKRKLPKHVKPKKRRS